MVFSSLLFLYLFLPLTVLCYFACRKINTKNWVLLAFSLLFYAWGEPTYVLVLLFSAALNYGAGLLLGRLRRTRLAKPMLIIAVAINLSILGIFKYSGFLIENINTLFGLTLTPPAFAMPIGISFYTFQALSYTIDVYRDHVGVQRSYRDFLLYVSLFPQLIAGPIVRYSEIEPQLANRSPSWESIFHGTSRFFVGLAKKVLIANYCGNVASRLLGGATDSMTTVGAWFGILMFAFEIYFDFSGYSDMAIGLGRVFGFRYAENFNLPYISRSITEFWRRWHISLGSFFRDYVYIPLGGNRKHQFRNLLIVWALTGLWHGASWNFVLWGLYFFVLIALEKRLRRQLAKIPAIVRWAATFLLLLLGWTLFYCTDFTRLTQTLGAMFGLYGAGFSNGQMKMLFVNNIPLLLVCIVGSTPVPRILWLAVNSVGVGKAVSKVRQVFYALCVFAFDLAVLLACTTSLVGSGYNPFLYFRF